MSTDHGAAAGDFVHHRDDKNVGILGIEVYTSAMYIQQSELEKYNQVPNGKYTIGLGQEFISIVNGDNEDINSICLTVVHNLLEKYNIDPMSVGRLEVGTETLVDKSKSTKTILMDLFPNNTDIEGTTVINACYGGTAALFNAITWCESDYWNGQYAIVVAADIATYASGPARPTSGMGAVALLIGRNAPIVFNSFSKATHSSNTWDFYKPDHNVEYPVVDGALSQKCYYQALEDVYERYITKLNQFRSKQCNNNSSSTSSSIDKKNDDYDVENVSEYFVFHAPYNKLVQKSYARLFLCDARLRYEKEIKNTSTVDNTGTKESSTDHIEGVQVNVTTTDSTRRKEIDSLLREFLEKTKEETYDDKTLENLLKKISSTSYNAKLLDSNRASQLIGNTYAASVFFGLASLIDRCGDKESGTADASKLGPETKITMFSYGSGAIASMYQLQIREPTVTSSVPSRIFTIQQIASCMQLTKRLQSRIELQAFELDYAMDTRARMHNAGVPYHPLYPDPTSGVCKLFPGTYYLKGIDDKWRRSYERVPSEHVIDTSNKTLAPTQVIQYQEELKNQSKSSQSANNQQDVQLSSYGEQRSKQLINCVITGTAAALPCGVNPFAKDNMDRLIAGDQFIAPISDEVKSAILEKNVVQLKKLKDGTIQRIPIQKEDQIIKLAAQLGTYDLTKHYGVVAGLAQTMDTAAQIAVAAGMEAMKNAGLVSGLSNDPSEWRVSEKYRDTTGVVYASSFPALDAAIGEVMRFLRSKTVHATETEALVETIRTRLLRSGSLSANDEQALRQLITRSKDAIDSDSENDGTAGNDEDVVIVGGCSRNAYEFDRKFLFKLLVLGNAQLAQLTGCRGPNTQTNAACAGTTQAIAMAQDMLLSGRAQRVVVIAGDNASNETLLPWLGSGFTALGAACTKGLVEEAALPFDVRRSGLLLGAGGIGMVIETEGSCIERMKLSQVPFEIKARLIATQYSNSAYHGAALDRKHIGSELQRFLTDIEQIHGITKSEIACRGVYFSHETCTHASPESSCSGNEVAALRYAFGSELLSKLLVVNTKGFTGHPMGVSFEDVTAVEVLIRQTVPPVPNYKEYDEYLGPLNISKGGSYDCQYALRFAAGFGSQVAFALYAKA